LKIRSKGQIPISKAKGRHSSGIQWLEPWFIVHNGAKGGNTIHSHVMKESESLLNNFSGKSA